MAEDVAPLAAKAPTLSLPAPDCASTMEATSAVASRCAMAPSPSPGADQDRLVVAQELIVGDGGEIGAAVEIDLIAAKRAGGCLAVVEVWSTHRFWVPLGSMRYTRPCGLPWSSLHGKKSNGVVILRLRMMTLCESFTLKPPPSGSERHHIAPSECDSGVKFDYAAKLDEPVKDVDEHRNR